MMPEQTVATILASLISLTGLVFALFWLYRDYCVDHLRQDLFALRDELFDAAAAGKISFDDPAYVMLRSTINGFIRFGHRLNLIETILLLIMPGSRQLLAETGPAFDRRWRNATKNMSSESRAVVETIYRRMSGRTLQHIVLVHPVLMASVVIPLVSWILASVFLELTLRVLREPISAINSAAFAYSEVS